MTVSIKFLSTFDGKGLARADKELRKFSKSALKLGRNLGLALGTTAVLAYGKASVKAFAADDKAAKILSRTLDNLGLHFADPKVKQFIASLEKQYGVLDDFLRPAYQKLLTTTGDYVKSQNLLKTALDLSAMSGVDVVSVADDLAKAYSGNTRGLIKYGIGLTKTQLAAMDFEQILTKIAEVSSGQAKIAADSYAGSIDKLKVAAANASESIGKDLVTALTNLGGTGGLPKTISLIESFSSGIGDAIIGISRLINLASKISFNPFDWKKVSDNSNKLQDAWKKADRIEAGIQFPDNTTGFGNLMAFNKNAKAKAAARKAAADKIKADKKAAATRAALDKKAAADKKLLSKGNALFDLEKIGVEAALRMSIDKETRLRLELLKAIQLEDADAILVKMKELTDWTKSSDVAKLSGIKTISEANLKSIDTTLLAELDAISKLKVSDAEKEALQTAAWGRYNDAIKYAGGLNNLSFYTQKTQDELLLIARLASIKTVSDRQKDADLARQAALDAYIASLKKITFPVAPVIPPVIPPIVVPIVPLLPGAPDELPGDWSKIIPPVVPPVETPLIPPVVSPVPPVLPPVADPGPILGGGTSKDDKDIKDLFEPIISDLITNNGNGIPIDLSGSSKDAKDAGIAVDNSGDTILNFNAPITTTSTDEFARLIQLAIQDNNRYGNDLKYAGAI